MLEMICRIPESVGWVIVGAIGMLTAIMAFKVGKLIVQAIKERQEDATDEECEE